MAAYKHIRVLILCLYFVTFENVRGLQLPEDVEMLEGYELPTSTVMQDDENQTPNNLVKAIRNRRELTYHFKGVPSFSSYEEGQSEFLRVPRSLQKRDLSNRLAKMDVSAQYTEQLAIARLDRRKKRDALEDEKKIENNKDDAEVMNKSENKEWIPQPSNTEDGANVVVGEESSTYNTPESLTDKQIGREIRGATKEQWIKLPYLRPVENEQLSSSSTGDELNHRMPRVNFVTQNKGLQASESRYQRESIPRSSYSRYSDLRTDIYPPSRARSYDYSTYSRSNYYRPDVYRRGYYDDLDYYDDFYYHQRADPYYDYKYDPRSNRRYDYSDYKYRSSGSRNDDYDYGKYDKPRRIIYYATLPEVSPNYRHYRYDDDIYYRDRRDRYDYRNDIYNSRYPYSALRKAENETPRDLSTSGSANKEKSSEAKRQQEMQKKNEEKNRDVNLNSHQYPINLSANMNVDSKAPHQTLYHDITRLDSDYQRYDHPSFQAAVDDPYVNRHD